MIWETGRWPSISTRHEPCHQTRIFELLTLCHSMPPKNPHISIRSRSPELPKSQSALSLAGTARPPDHWQTLTNPINFILYCQASTVFRDGLWRAKALHWHCHFFLCNIKCESNPDWVRSVRIGKVVSAAYIVRRVDWSPLESTGVDWPPLALSWYRIVSSSSGSAFGPSLAPTLPNIVKSCEGAIRIDKDQCGAQERDNLRRLKLFSARSVF